MFTFTALGKPVPQGSKRWLPGGRMVEANSALRPWRATVTAAAAQAWQKAGLGMYTGPVTLVCEFTFTRPKGHYGTGKNAGIVKDNAPVYMSSMPDLDKLIRAVQDALSDAGIWKDDAQVVRVQGEKRYAEQAGVVVFIYEETESLWQR